MVPLEDAIASLGGLPAELVLNSVSECTGKEVEVGWKVGKTLEATRSATSL